MRDRTKAWWLGTVVFLTGCPRHPSSIDAGVVPDGGPDAGPLLDAGDASTATDAAGLEAPALGTSSGSARVTSENFRVVVDVGGPAPHGATTSPSYRLRVGPASP